MNVSNIELCRELYELSGWEPNKELEGVKVKDRTPPYDAGYLLRKLPKGCDIFQNENGKWECWRLDGETPTIIAATPEDALSKLAITLIKEGIIKV